MSRESLWHSSVLTNSRHSTGSAGISCSELSFISVFILFLYNGSESCIQTSPVQSKWMASPLKFSIYGVVSVKAARYPPLYVLVAEVFALSIRANNNIKGIQINDRTKHKISQYVDDTILTVVGDDSIDWFSHTVTYECASGAKINLDKCEGLWTGTNKHGTCKLGSTNRENQLKVSGPAQTKTELTNHITLNGTATRLRLSLFTSETRTWNTQIGIHELRNLKEL